MTKFIVEVREVCIREVLIEAADAEEAKRKIRDGEGDTVLVGKYSHTLDSDLWTVKE